jgi:hypothetical protein
MISKTQIIDSLDKMPDSVTIDQVIEHLIFIEKVQKGHEDSASGNTYTKDEAKEKLNKWLR